VVKVPNLLLLFAGIHTAFFFCRPLARAAGSASIYFKSFLNSYKYLSPIVDRHPSLPVQQKKAIHSTRSQPTVGPPKQPRQPRSNHNENAYAVIYGAGNKAGRAFAYYLMQRGFNLILIERDAESLNKLNAQLRTMLPDQNSDLVHCVLSQFDQQTILHVAGKYAAYPVKMFINCKSSK